MAFSLPHYGTSEYLGPVFASSAGGIGSSYVLGRLGYDASISCGGRGGPVTWLEFFSFAVSTPAPPTANAAAAFLLRRRLSRNQATAARNASPATPPTTPPAIARAMGPLLEDWSSEELDEVVDGSDSDGDGALVAVATWSCKRDERVESAKPLDGPVAVAPPVALHMVKLALI